MMKKHLLLSACLLAGLATGQARAQTTPPSPAPADTPVFMSPDWIKALCAAWNNTPQLTHGLAAGWVHNDGGQGYKILTLADSICTVSAPVELKIAARNGFAECIYGGALTVTKLDYSHDYSMWATTANWMKMGSPMTAMMFGRLNFRGPKLEAMSNMGPFGGFLHLVSTVPGSVHYCPPKGPNLSM